MEGNDGRFDQDQNRRAQAESAENKIRFRREKTTPAENQKGREMSFSEEMVKDFFSKCEKDVLCSFIYTKLNILSDTERRVLRLKYCERLPMKCIAADIQKSERYAKALHKNAIEKALPIVYCFVLRAFSRSLSDDD